MPKNQGIQRIRRGAKRSKFIKSLLTRLPANAFRPQVVFFRAYIAQSGGEQIITTPINRTTKANARKNIRNAKFHDKIIRFPGYCLSATGLWFSINNWHWWEYHLIPSPSRGWTRFPLIAKLKWWQYRFSSTENKNWLNVPDMLSSLLTLCVSLGTAKQSTCIPFKSSFLAETVKNAFEPHATFNMCSKSQLKHN